jgi:exonuclease III
MHLIGKTKDRLKVKGWKKIFKENGTRKQAGVAILTSDKANIKPKLAGRQRRSFIWIKRTTHQGDISIVDRYVPNTGTVNFIKETLLNIKVQITP